MPDSFEPNPQIQLLLRTVGNAGDAGPFIKSLCTQIQGAATRVWDAVDKRQNPPPPKTDTVLDLLTANLDWADKSGMNHALGQLQELTALLTEVRFALASSALVMHEPKQKFKWAIPDAGTSKAPATTHDQLNPLAAGVKPVPPLDGRAAHLMQPFGTRSNPLGPPEETKLLLKHYCLGCMARSKVAPKNDEHATGQCFSCGRQRDVYPVLVPPSLTDLQRQAKEKPYPQSLPRPAAQPAAGAAADSDTTENLHVRSFEV